MIPVIIKVSLDGTTSMPLFISGLMLVLIGMAFRMFSAGFFLGRHIVTEIEANFLCASGRFAYIRNPLYIGNMIVGFGIALSLNEWYGYAILALNYTYMYSIIIPYEEAFLEEKFSNSYTKYKAQVRRFLPRLKGYKDCQEVIPNFKLAFLSEKYYLLILLITYVFFYFFFLSV